MSLLFKIATVGIVSIALCASSGLARAEGEAAGAAGHAAASAKAGGETTLELNKLESYDKGCRAYVVVTNTGGTTYQSFKLDLVLFQKDGVIGKRFALDLAPVKAEKKAVKLFDIEGMACDKIGSFLINDVIDCKADSGGAEACLQKLSTSSLTNVQLSK